MPNLTILYLQARNLSGSRSRIVQEVWDFACLALGFLLCCRGFCVIVWSIVGVTGLGTPLVDLSFEKGIHYCRDIL
jgi:hypothetical protein